METHERSRSVSAPISTGLSAATYVIVTAAAAVAAPVVGSRDLALVLWLVGIPILVLAIARSVFRSSSTQGNGMRLARSLAIAVGVSATCAFVAFVLLVNIWERLGLPH
jgi:hypothetical protein